LRDDEPKETETTRKGVVEEGEEATSGGVKTAASGMLKIIARQLAFAKNLRQSHLIEGRIVAAFLNDIDSKAWTTISLKRLL
jgi:hypothetical protein